MGQQHVSNIALIHIERTYANFVLENDIERIIIHAEHVVHRRGYCFHLGCMFVCLYVSALETKKLDRNDLKLGTVVLLNSPPKPIDFVPNRFRGKGAGKKRNLGPPQYLCIG